MGYPLVFWLDGPAAELTAVSKQGPRARDWALYSVPPVWHYLSVPRYDECWLAHRSVLVQSSAIVCESVYVFCAGVSGMCVGGCMVVCVVRAILDPPRLLIIVACVRTSVCEPLFLGPSLSLSAQLRVP